MLPRALDDPRRPLRPEERVEPLLELGCLLLASLFAQEPRERGERLGLAVPVVRLGQHVEGLSEEELRLRCATLSRTDEAEHHRTFDRDIMSCIPTVSTADSAQRSASST